MFASVEHLSGDDPDDHEFRRQIPLLPADDGLRKALNIAS